MTSQPYFDNLTPDEQESLLRDVAEKCDIHHMLGTQPYDPARGLSLVTHPYYWNPVHNLDHALRLAASMDISIRTTRTSATTGSIVVETSSTNAYGVAQKVTRHAPAEFVSDADHERLMCWLIVWVAYSYDCNCYRLVSDVLRGFA